MILASTSSALLRWIAARISLPDCPFSSITWWAGDTVGVLVFTPIFLPVATSLGPQPLGRFVRVEAGTRASARMRKNLRPVIYVTGDVAAFGRIADFTPRFAHKTWSWRRNTSRCRA